MRFLDFRQAIDSLQDSYIHKLYYLTGSRANELCGVGATSQKSGKTRPLAPTKQDVDYDNFEGTEILKIRLQVQKRKEVNGAKPLRTVGVPLSKEMEPWALDVSKVIEGLSENDVLIRHYRQEVNRLFRETGMYKAALSLKENENKQAIKNPLRHIRIHFLMDYYHMRPEEVVAMVGWEPRSSGIPGLSGMLKDYAYMNWTLYIPRLLKPLPSSALISEPKEVVI